MASGWWDGVAKAIEIVGGLTGGGRASNEPDPAQQGRGLMSGIEARLAGVLVSALHEAFARDAVRLDVEREQAEAESRRAEVALRLEMARQEADRQLAQLRAIVAIDIVVWLASLLAVVFHPATGALATVLLAGAWAALTAGVGAAFVAYGRVSDGASLKANTLGSPAASTRPRVLETASWLTVGGLGLAAASVIALVV
jgi:hypothetical protein